MTTELPGGVAKQGGWSGSAGARGCQTASVRPIYGYEFEGTRYDVGDPLGFLTAQVGFGLKRADLADSFRAYLRTIFSSL